MKHRILVLCLVLSAFVWGLSGCAGTQVQKADIQLDNVTIRPAVTEASPQDAVVAVYEMLPDSQTEPLDTARFYSLFPDLTGQVENHYGRISNVNGGLADLIILTPKEGERDTARNALLNYQEARIKEFENYDILDAFQIASSALVFDRGEYIILLMLPDNEVAQDIIDQYIPL